MAHAARWGPRALLKLAFMYGVRFVPLPAALKGHIIWWLQPHVVQVAVGVVPDGNGNVLLLRARYSGYWLLPGGAVNAGETPLAGVLRECREELGQQVTVERLTGIYADPKRKHVLFGFRCAPLAGPPHLSEEHDAFRYGPCDGAISPLVQIARDALANAPGVRIERVMREA